MSSYLYLLLIPPVCAVLLKAYLKLTTGVCRSRRSLEGKTAIVTGGNTGIGFQTALDFARRNGRVIIACRNMVKGQEARARIIEESGNKNVIVKALDLSSLTSVRQFARDVVGEEAHLEILVNNAGMMGYSNQLTEDGLDVSYSTNHLGPFLLTNLLLDLLKKSSPSRIVNLSSVAHKIGSIDFKNLHAGKSFNTGKVYCDVKLATILFTRELAKRLAGTGVVANCVHPGTVQTELLRDRPVMAALFAFFLKSAKEGAQTSIHCAVSEEVEGISGKYFADCAVVSPAQHACDKDVARRLWTVSNQLVGLGQ